MAIKINGATVIDDSQAFTSTSTVSATGNITGGNIRTAGTISATGDATAANLFTAGVISATGNIIGGNIVGTIAGNVTTAVVSASGNITGGNIITSGLISATGNITGGNLVLPAATGNIIAHDITAGGAVLVTGIVSAAGNVRGDNFNTVGAVSATGNVTGGNLRTGGTISAAGNITGANLSVTSDAVITGNLTVNGTTTTVNSNTVTINDKFINVANNASSSTLANGGGLGVGPVGSEYATLEYNQAGNTWNTNIGLSVTGNITGDNLSVGTGTVTVGNIVNGNGNGVGNIGSSSTYFNTVFAKATSAQYADLAEKYTADADYEPGTVVCFGGAEEVTICSADACRRVAGVISTNPSYIMNGTLSAAHVATVALTGRVPTRVTGTVRKGDLMVAAGNGTARAEADPRVGSVIGKALADHDGAEGVIEVVIGRF